MVLMKQLLPKNTVTISRKGEKKNVCKYKTAHKPASTEKAL